MTKYLRGSKIECKTTVKDSSENVTNPSTLSLEIIDPIGTIIVTKVIGDLTKESTGIYTYLYSIPSDALYGDWQYKFTATTTESTIVNASYFTIDAFDSSLDCSILDVYRKAGVDSSVISNEDVADHILEAGAEVNTLMGRSFKNAQSVTEWHDIEELDEDDRIKIIFLDKRPIQSITSMVSYDKTDTAVITWTSDDYWIDLDIGTIRLKTKEFAQQNHRVKIVYTYGYEIVPTNIKNLVGNIAAMRIITQQIGGTYDDVTSYSLPSGVSIGVGEPYTNMREALTRLEKANTEILKAIGVLKTSVLVI